MPGSVCSAEPQWGVALLERAGWLHVLQHCARMLGSWQRPSQRSVWQKRLVSRSRTQTAPVGGDGDFRSTQRTVTGTPWDVSILTSPIMWSSTSCSWFLTISSSLITTKSYHFTLIENNSLEGETKTPKLLLERVLITSTFGGVESGKKKKENELIKSKVSLPFLSWRRRGDWGGGLDLPALWAEQRWLKIKGWFNLQLKLSASTEDGNQMHKRVNNSSKNVKICWD